MSLHSVFNIHTCRDLHRIFFQTTYFCLLGEWVPALILLLKESNLFPIWIKETI